MQLSHPALRYCRAGLACAALLAGACASAAAASFVSGLSPEQGTAVGLSKLSDSQAAVLDALVAQDVTLAHEGGVSGFSSSFSARHWDRERDASGLDRLSAQERAALDTYVAQSIAIGPPPEQAFMYSPPKVVPPKAPAPSVVSVLKHADVHGDVSFTVGAGSHGSSFYGTSMDVNVTDPTGHFTVGIGFDEFRGKGLIGLCGPDGLYGPPYYGAPYFGGW